MSEDQSKIIINSKDMGYLLHAEEDAIAKLYSSPHVIPLLVFSIMIENFVFNQPFLERHGIILSDLHEEDRVALMLFMYSQLRLSYVELSVFVGKVKQLLSNHANIWKLFRLEVWRITKDITFFAPYMNSLKIRSIKNRNEQAFPNEIDIFINYCLISFYASDISKLLDLLWTVHSGMLGFMLDDISEIQKDDGKGAVRDSPLSLKPIYTNINLKHYIKCLVVNLERGDNIAAVRDFVTDSPTLIAYFPYFKKQIEYLVQLYKKYTGNDEENVDSIDLNWRNYASSQLFSSQNKMHQKSVTQDGNESSTVSSKRKTRIVSTEGSVPFKFELIRSSFDQVNVLLSSSNISAVELGEVVTCLNHILNYILSSNRTNSFDLYLMHLCFCWNSYVDLKFQNSNEKLAALHNSTHQENLEIVDSLRFKHFYNSLNYTLPLLANEPTVKKLNNVSSCLPLQFFVLFQKYIHSFNEITPKNIQQFTSILSNASDMALTSAVYRAYCYHMLGFTDPVKSILKCIIAAHQTTTSGRSDFDRVRSNVVLSIYDSHNTVFAALTLLIQLGANTNDADTDIEKYVDIVKIVVGKNTQQLDFFFYLKNVYKAFLEKDPVAYEHYVCDLLPYYPETSEYAKNICFRLAYLKGDIGSIMPQLESRYKFFCESTSASSKEPSLTMSLDTLDALMSSCTIYVKALKKCGRAFEAIRVLTDLIERSKNLNCFKYMAIHTKLMRSFLKYRGCKSAESFLKEAAQRYSSVFCSKL